MGNRNTQSHCDGHPISADPGTVNRKNKHGAMTIAAKKNACLHNHTVLSHSMGQQDWETSEHLTNSEILSQHKEQCMYLMDKSFLVSRESFEKIFIQLLLR